MTDAPVFYGRSHNSAAVSRLTKKAAQMLNGLAGSALGIRAQGPGFDFRVVPLFHWVATLGKWFTHVVSPAPRNWGTKMELSARRLSGYGD